ncbi:Alpha/beta hydrolase related protein [Zea mays]|uniref:Alpha/beta hydrolase related protein n=1 Tax=Zea mays TaxID=4577 RepID=A0A1D6P8U5_MAIZE|nr:Alpha/beta hydrolase related protein [Zea mays]
MEKKPLMPLAVAHKHAHGHGGGAERTWARPWRWAKTAFVLAAMLASLLLVCAPPLLVVLLDLALPPALLSATLRGSLAPAVVAQARAFDFRSSLVDLPAVSAARALLILCAPRRGVQDQLPRAPAKARVQDGRRRRREYRDSPSALQKPSRLRIILDANASNSRDFVRSCTATVQGSYV